MTEKLTPLGEATGSLIFEVLRVYGRLLAAGDALLADLGLTSARWQVLGTIAASGEALTVSDLARILGQSRQSIQRLANEMDRDGVVEFTANPGHKRSMYVVPTETGRRLHSAVESRRIPWTEAIARHFECVDVAQAARAVALLRKILERDQII